MATCKDCLHTDVCYMVEHYGVDINEDRQERDCYQFQAKTNCVKAVRCKDCVFWDYQGVGSSSLKRFGGCKKWYPCGNEQHSCHEDDFCSCGVNREEADDGS